MSVITYPLRGGPSGNFVLNTASVQANGLLCWWPLGAYPNAVDKALFANHGTLVNGPVPGAVAGRRGLEFDGANDYMNAGDITSTNGVSQMTVTAWVLLQNQLNDSYAGVVSKEQSGTARWCILQNSIQSNVFVAVSSGSNTFGVTSDNFLTANEWHHVAMVFNGNETGNANRLKFYAGGTQRSLSFTGTIPATTASNSAPVLVGTNTTSSNRWDGLIDDVRIYSRPLSAAELSAIYHQTMPGEYGGLAADPATIFPVAASASAGGRRSPLHGPFVGPFGGPIG